MQIVSSSVKIETVTTFTVADGIKSTKPNVKQVCVFTSRKKSLQL